MEQKGFLGLVKLLCNAALLNPKHVHHVGCIYTRKAWIPPLQLLNGAGRKAVWAHCENLVPIPD